MERVENWGDRVASDWGSYWRRRGGALAALVEWGLRRRCRACIVFMAGVVGWAGGWYW